MGSVYLYGYNVTDRHIFGDAGIPTLDENAISRFKAWGTRGMRGDRRLQLLQDHHSLFQSFQSFLSSTLFHSLRFNRWFIKEIGMIRIIVAKIFVFLPIFDRSIVGQLRLEKGPQSSNSTNDVIALLDPSIGRRPNSIRTIVRPGSHLRIRTRVRIIILRDDESSKSRKIDKPKS